MPSRHSDLLPPLFPSSPSVALQPREVVAAISSSPLLALGGGGGAVLPSRGQVIKETEEALPLGGSSPGMRGLAITNSPQVKSFLGMGRVCPSYPAKSLCIA